MNLLIQALSSYGSKYKREYSNLCRVDIPENANWCGVFIGWVLACLGYKLPPKPQVARSYLKVGVPVEKPRIGDLAIFYRVSPSDWRGHVSIVIREDDTGVYCLGGNQKGKVQISRYQKKKLLGYRRLIDDPATV